MSGKRGLGWITVIASLLVLGSWVLWAPASRVFAQCENPGKPSCLTCHAQQGLVSQNDPLHALHARQYMCIDCHGGNGSATDESLAHQDLVAQPLDDTYTSCHSCHPAYAASDARPKAGPIGQPTVCTAASVGLQTSGTFGTPSSDSASALDRNALRAAQMPLISTVTGLGLLAFCFGLHWLDRHRLQG